MGRWRWRRRQCSHPRRNLRRAVALCRPHRSFQRGELSPARTAGYGRCAHAAGAAPVLENEHFRLIVDPARGGISRLVEQGAGIAGLIAGQQPFRPYRYDLFSAADIAVHLRAYGLLFQDWFIADFGKAGQPENWPHLTAWAGDYTATLEHGPGRQTLLLTGGTLRPTRNGPTVAPAQTVDLAITLDDHLPAIDLRYTVHGKVAIRSPKRPPPSSRSTWPSPPSAWAQTG